MLTISRSLLAAWECSFGEPIGRPACRNWHWKASTRWLAAAQISRVPKAIQSLVSTWHTLKSQCSLHGFWQSSYHPNWNFYLKIQICLSIIFGAACCTQLPWIPLHLDDQIFNLGLPVAGYEAHDISRSSSQLGDTYMCHGKSSNWKNHSMTLSTKHWKTLVSSL